MTPGGSDPRARPSAREEIESPAPTAWPMVLAFGITLIFGGLVTNAIVSALGLVLSLVAAFGWWRQVLPEPHVEHVTLAPMTERAKPVAPARGVK